MSRIDDEALEWVARQAAGNLDARDQAAFEAWYAAHPRHQGAYLRALAIQHSLDGIGARDGAQPPAEAVIDAPAALTETLPLPLHSVPARGQSARRRFLGGALAAGLAAVAALSLAPRLKGRTILATARGELLKAPLADGSTVSINSASRVEIAFTGSERRVLLDHGEAWFEVAKDKAKPFIVEAGALRVRAVGTAFSVVRRKDGADVLVTEGVVEAWHEGGKDGAAGDRHRLAAGAIASVSDGSAEVKALVDAEAVERSLAWREGKLMFHNDTLESAVAAFNRYNARQLVIGDPALRRKTLVGRYRIDQPENFANDMHALLDVPVAVGKDQIRIGAAAASSMRN